MQSSNWLHRQPMARLARISRWVNALNAVFLIVAGGLGFWGDVMRPLDGAFESALLSIYTTGFGVMLLRYELRLGRESLQRDYGIMFTFGGRCAFLLLTANLCWTCGDLGLPAAIATNINAALNVYLLISHPAFTSGEMSWMTIGDLAVGGETFTPVPRDPAAVAQSERAGLTDALHQYALPESSPSAATLPVYDERSYRHPNEHDEML
jgi:hypothetical protein